MNNPVTKLKNQIAIEPGLFLLVKYGFDLGGDYLEIIDKDSKRIRKLNNTCEKSYYSAGVDLYTEFNVRGQRDKYEKEWDNWWLYETMTRRIFLEKEISHIFQAYELIGQKNNHDFYEKTMELLSRLNEKNWFVLCAYNLNTTPELLPILVENKVFVNLHKTYKEYQTFYPVLKTEIKKIQGLNTGEEYSQKIEKEVEKIWQKILLNHRLQTDLMKNETVTMKKIKI